MKRTESQPEAGIALNENLSKYCGWAVVAGLVIEVALAVIYRGHTSWIENWAPVFADALIALGVFGEIHFAGKVSKSEDELRRISDEKVAEALARAASSEERAASLEKEAASARLE